MILVNKDRDNVFNFERGVNLLIISPILNKKKKIIAFGLYLDNNFLSDYDTFIECIKDRNSILKSDAYYFVVSKKSGWIDFEIIKNILLGDGTDEEDN